MAFGSPRNHPMNLAFKWTLRILRKQSTGSNRFQQMAENLCIFYYRDEMDATLKKIVRTHGGFTEDAASRYANEMVLSKRYVRDVYWNGRCFVRQLSVDTVKTVRIRCFMRRPGLLAGLYQSFAPRPLFRASAAVP